MIGRKSNKYSLLDVNNEEIRKVKVVNNIVVKNIRNKEYIDVLFNKNVIWHKTKRIQRKLQRFGTYEVCKNSLSCFDNRRYILDDDINSLACVHKVASGL